LEHVSSSSAQCREDWTPRPVDPHIPRYEPRAIATPNGAGWLTGEGKARISGSDHGRWIVERCCAAFCQLQPDAAFDVDLRGTPSAMAFLMSGKSMFSVMGREITPVEIVPYRKLIGAPPVAIRIAHTAEETSQHLATSLGVYVHRSNPLTRITTEQLSKMFSVGNPGGDYSRWGQLGLSGEWAKRQIHPIGTPEYTGFGTYMQAHHLEGRPLSPVYERYVGTDDVLGRLAADPSGVAVAAIGRETEGLRLLPIAQHENGPYSDGCTDDVQNDRYAFGRFLYFYVPQRLGEPVDPFTAEYLRYVLSFEGQSIIAEQPGGYIPLRPDEIATERARLDHILSEEGK
jgi:phosphate transport system substrate-binding protein